MKINLDDIKKDINEPYIKSVEIDWYKHAKYIQTIAEILYPRYNIDDNNKDILKQLLLYFTGNADFKGSLQKGIMLIGGIGTGKTLLFQIFKAYTQSIRNNSFQEFTINEIISSININGIEYLKKFGENNDGIKSYPITCYIDDLLNSEAKVKHFGTDIDVLHELISIRYRIFQRYKTITHTTSNIYPNDFKNSLDMRDIDRIKEMFNMIELKGESRRQ